MKPYQIGERWIVKFLRFIHSNDENVFPSFYSYNVSHDFAADKKCYESEFLYGVSCLHLVCNAVLIKVG